MTNTFYSPSLPPPGQSVERESTFSEMIEIRHMNNNSFVVVAVRAVADCQLATATAHVLLVVWLRNPRGDAHQLLSKVETCVCMVDLFNQAVTEGARYSPWKRDRKVTRNIVRHIHVYIYILPPSHDSIAIVGRPGCLLTNKRQNQNINQNMKFTIVGYCEKSDPPIT